MIPAPPSPGALFHDRPAQGPAQAKRLEASFAALGPAFESRTEHDAFLNVLYTPASGRWCFASSGKTGTTSALAMLFELEFGVPLTARVADPADMNADAAQHRTVMAGVFRLLPQRGDVPDIPAFLASTLRIATVRHPTARAWSAFRYLCRSQALGHIQFAAERIRLCALTGFDWTRDPDRPEGFLRFLDYVETAVAHAATRMPDNHWRPQWMDIRPDVFRPDILGRCEDLRAFAAALADRLRPDAPPPAVPHRNAGDTPAPDWLARADIRAKLAAVYARDYEDFGYEP